MKSRCCIGLSYLACFVAFNYVNPTNAKRGALRSTKVLSTVECLYAKKAISYADGTDNIVDDCIASHDGAAHDLPNGFVDNKLLSGRTHFRIHGAKINKDKHNVENIEGIEKAQVEVFQPQGGRHLSVTTTGNHKVLVVRVTSLDGQVLNNRATLGQLIFGDGVTLKGMYKACSFGKLNMIPFQGPGVVNGVAEIFINTTVASQNPQLVENIVMQQVRPKFGWEGSAFDHIMIMLPPGTAGEWLAYSYIGAFRSVFNNDWSGYVSAHVHEIGHTLGFFHSSRAGNEYLDQTGFMGYSAPVIGSPSKCFNGHKNYMLGWFSDRTLEINTSSLPWTGNLVTFVDYDKTRSNEPVLIKVNDLYLQYNRAKLFNSETSQNQDEVTITKGPSSSAASTAVGSLSMSNTTYTVVNYQGTVNLVIEACSQQFASNNGRADLYQVSIHLDSQPSGCPANTQRSRTSVPTIPTPQPARRTPAPSKLLTSKPTTKPIATAKPTCVDNSAGTFQYRGATRSCAWLATRPFQQTLLCVQGSRAHRLCRATCKSCS